MLYYLLYNLHAQSLKSPKNAVGSRTQSELQFEHSALLLRRSIQVKAPLPPSHCLHELWFEPGTAANRAELEPQGLMELFRVRLASHAGTGGVQIQTERVKI